MRKRAATITPLVTRPERLRQDQAAQLQAALETVEVQLDLPAHVARDLRAVVARRTAASGRWTFIMLSPEQNDAVVGYLAAHSSRPLVAVRLWASLFRHLRQDTGEVLLTRDQIATALGELPRNVSTVMSELEDFGAVIRKRERVAGMRGPGAVRYFLNPRVATHLGGQERDAAQAAAPPLLTLMNGGRRD